MAVLTQYIVVRRDIPDIRKIIDVGHATGEAFYLFATIGLAPDDFELLRTTLIVRGARNENKLLRLEQELILKNVPHIAVREPDAPWNGQLMAIGLVPGNREKMSQYVNEFQNLKLGSLDED